MILTFKDHTRNNGRSRCDGLADITKDAHQVMNLPKDLFVHDFFFWDILTRIPSPDREKSLIKSFFWKNTDDLNLGRG
jgi:hypothetical protein